MQQFIDNLISRLEETKRTALDKVKLPIPMPIILSKRSLQEVVDMCFEEAIRIVNELAEEPRPQTNADRIRSMSDEELLQVLVYCPHCTTDTGPCRHINDDVTCEQCGLEWLHSEVKEGEQV